MLALNAATAEAIGREVNQATIAGVKVKSAAMIATDNSNERSPNRGAYFLFVVAIKMNSISSSAERTLVIKLSLHMIYHCHVMRPGLACISWFRRITVNDTVLRSTFC